MPCRSGYAPVVHCGSVRQAAKVLTMRELSLSELSSPAHTEAISPAIAAAAAILGHPGASWQCTTASLQSRYVVTLQ